MRAVESRWIDRAVLDVNLNGEMSFAIADRLDAAAIPYVIATGYSAEFLPERFRRKPRLAKPFQAEQVVAMMIAPAMRGAIEAGREQPVEAL